MEALESARGFLDAAVQALEDKKRRVFEHVKLALEAPPVDAGAVEKLNAVIRKHNQACDAFETRGEKARKRLATDMIAAELEEFVRRRDAEGGATANEQATEQEVQRLDGEIARLEREILEHRQPAEELNEDLRKYLGHHELCLEIKETGYTITRGGVPAHSLSEGETTAIALLYFLKSLQDRRFALANGVIVLDDPSVESRCERVVPRLRLYSGTHGGRGPAVRLDPQLLPLPTGPQLVSPSERARTRRT